MQQRVNQAIKQVDQRVLQLLVHECVRDDVRRRGRQAVQVERHVAAREREERRGRNLGLGGRACGSRRSASSGVRSPAKRPILAGIGIELRQAVAVKSGGQ